MESQAAYTERLNQKKGLYRNPDKYFYVASSGDFFANLSSYNLARTVYLASYLRFDTDELWKNSASRLRRSDLKDIMNLSSATADRFWSEVNGKFFFRDKEGFIHSLGKAFVAGHLLATPSAEYQQLYISALREIYKKVPLKQHARLGYVFQMLPFINFEYNILCENPTEKEYDNIIPMSVSDFCGKIGFDYTHTAELARKYGKITFTVNGREEVFCKFVYNGDRVDTAHIFINPRLVYKGMDFQKVEAIGISFAADSRPTCSSGEQNHS